MNNTSIDEARALRVTLESMIKLPAVLTVGRAADEDDSGSLCCGLARAFAAAGYRTVMVDPYGGTAVSSALNLSVPQVDDLGHLADHAMIGKIENLSVVGLGHKAEARNAPFQKMFASVSQLRRSFDVAVIDAQTITDNPIALSFAAVSDGVLLAVQFGRKPVAGDRDVITRLELVGANVLGIVACGDERERRPEPARRPDVRELEEAAQPVARPVRRFATTGTLATGIEAEPVLAR
jgi:Mrp family chromosome partitioning ATPase